jgi:hypothetical protein
VEYRPLALDSRIALTSGGPSSPLNHSCEICGEKRQCHRSLIRPKPRFRFAAGVDSLQKASFGFPSVGCLRLRIGHASCQRPRQRPPRIGFCRNHLQADEMSLGVLAEEYRRAAFARALLLSDRIVRLSDQLVERGAIGWSMIGGNRAVGITVPAVPPPANLRRPSGTNSMTGLV